MALKRTGSFSSAAKACFVSQPALSEAIQKLEKEIGVVVFDRSKNPVRVTEVGELVLTQAQVILSEVQRLGEVVCQWNGDVKGILRIGIIPTLAPSMIPIFLGAFRRRYPEVRIEIQEYETAQLLKRLNDDEIDGALLSTPSFAPGHFLEKPLFYEGFVVYAAKGSDILQNDFVSFPDLEDQNLILMDESHCLRDQILTICDRQKSKSQKITVHGGIQTLLAIINESGGFTLLPELLTIGMNKGQLRPIKPSSYRRRVSLLSKKNHPRRRILNFLVEEIENHLPPLVSKRIQKKHQVVDPDPRRF